MSGKRLGIVSIVVCACLTSVRAEAQEQASPKPQVTKVPTPSPNATAPSIEGVYVVEGGSEQVRVKRISDGIFYVAAEGWEGVGILDAAIYHGLFRDRVTPGAPAAAMGEQSIDWRDPANPVMKATYTTRRTGQFSERWRRIDAVTPPVAKPPPPAPGRKPEFGEYVYVEELPEAISKVAPVYPDLARRDGIEGTVVVQALVLEDGTVGDCRIVNSIPMLDEAAIACVRQWRFKPALTGGKPVAVWVAVPIRFAKP